MNKQLIFLLLFFCVVLITAGRGQKANDATPQLLGPYSISDLALEADPTLKLTTYVNRIYQDSRGTLWFGTVVMGVARYDGESLEYFSTKEGFGGEAVRGIAEDQAGNVWFATSGGISKYDGESFTNFTEANGLIDHDVWSIAIDSKGIIWVGTLEGLCYFDGEEFTPFVLPAAAPDPTRDVTSAQIVHCIMEDRKGHMWFGTNGGAYRYDPDNKSLHNLYEKDGLCNNAVNSILEDKNGKYWFATYHNGVCRWDPTTGSTAYKAAFTQIPTRAGRNGTNAWDLYEDTAGNIWFPIKGVGMYRHDGQAVTEIFQQQNCISHTIRSIFEDNQGRLWFGGWLGVYRYDPSASLRTSD